MPEIIQTFEIDQPVTRVWAFFDDIPQVVHCMPGVELLEELGDGAFKGRMRVKVGPIIANFAGEATIIERDDSKHSGTISAQGADQQGGSRASAKVRYTLTGRNSGTSVEITADVALQGTMARFGRTGIIQDVSSRLTQELADCLRTKLSASSLQESAEVRAKDVEGIRLLFLGLWASLKRLFSRR